MAMKVLTTEKSTIKLNNRTPYYDYLRVLSTFAVIILHVAAQNFRKVEIGSFQWDVFNFTDSAVRWCVPIFVMISGALFLDNNKPLTLKKLYGKNILRIVTAFVFWSVIYATYNVIDGKDLRDGILIFVKGNYHLWFLFMIAGLYVIVPLLRKITASKSATQYFIIVGFIFSFLIPRTINLLQILKIPHTTGLLKAISLAFDNVHFNFTAGFVLYFVLGYYISHYDIKKSLRIVAYVIGFIAYLFTAFFTEWVSLRDNKVIVDFYENYTVNVLLTSVAVFIFAKYVLSKIELKGLFSKLVSFFSKYSFGVYLVHILVLDIFKTKLEITTLSFHPVISIIVLTVTVATISYAISFILNHIPIFKKYIV